MLLKLQGKSSTFNVFTFPAGSMVQMASREVIPVEAMTEVILALFRWV